MRGFFLLLLLTNVGFLLWQYQHQGGAVPEDTYANVQMQSEGLTLLSELAADKRPALREEVQEQEVARAQPAPAAVSTEPPLAAGQEPGAVGPGVCLRLVGFEERSLLDSLSAELRERQAAALEQGSEQSHKVSYWVMLPPYADRDKAAEAADILKQKRIRDFFIVRSGDYENAVSLGVFSTRERAERRYQQIAALKARLRRPRIESIELPAKRYWLNFTVGDEAQHRAVEKLVSGYPQLKLEEIRCEQPD